MGVRTVSNDTRVRADGLVKIIAIVSPAKGLNCSSLLYNAVLATLALRSIARSSSEEKSSMCKKCRLPPFGGRTVDPVYDNGMLLHATRRCEEGCDLTVGSLIVPE